MSDTQSVQLRKCGVLTLPKSFRDQHDLSEGDALSIIDLGGGAFVVTPTMPGLPELSRKLERIREEEGVSLNDLLDGLDEERRRLAGGSDEE